MTDEQMLSMLKIDLGITTTAYDARLAQYIQSAAVQIAREGAADLNTSESLDDAQLVILYAAWMWRKRDTGDGMPRMLRYALNNRIFASKARG